MKIGNRKSLRRVGRNRLRTRTGTRRRDRTTVATVVEDDWKAFDDYFALRGAGTEPPVYSNEPVTAEVILDEW